MNVSLTPELEKFVAAKVESGRYTSASEVVREALRLLERWYREEGGEERAARYGSIAARVRDSFNRRFWFEQGSLGEERKVADFLKYKVENRSIAGIDSIVMHPDDANGACGVASDAAGVVGWWVNPQAPGVDACAQAIKLMELTLATNS